MLKKFFLFFTIAIALLLFTNFSFAADDFNSGVDNLGNDIKQTVDKTRETIGNIEQGAENAVGNMGEKVNEMMHSGDNNKEQDNSGYSANRRHRTPCRGNRGILTDRKRQFHLYDTKNAEYPPADPLWAC